MRSQLLFALILFVGGTLNSQTIVYHDLSDTIISSGFEVLLDSSGDLKLEDAISSIAKDVKSDTFTGSDNVYWLHFRLKNTTGERQHIILNFHKWSYVDFYYRTEGDFQLKKTGHLLPYRERDYPTANKAFISADLEATGELECMVRLESRYNNELKPTNLEFGVYEESVIVSATRNSDQAVFLFLGALLIMLAYTFFVFISSRNRSYGFFLMVVILSMYHTAYNSGHIISLFGFWDSFPTLLTYFETTSSNLFAVVTILFAQEFLQLKERYPKWNRPLNWIMYATIASTAINFFDYQLGLDILGMIGFLWLVIVTVCLVKSVIRKYPSSIHFLIGWIIFVVGGMVVAFAVQGVIPWNNFTIIYALPAGTALPTIVFAFALANLITVLRRENEDKQAQIIVQMEENQELQTKVTRELEQKVQERTSEINRQKELIEVQKDEIEKEKIKSDQLLLNVLPKSTAEELREFGIATAKSYENVSVMFSDIADFTRITETMSTEDLVADLDYCFGAFDDIVAGYGLEKIKTIGDSYMAVSGAPIQADDHAEKAIKAAMDMLRFMDEWQAKKKEQGKLPWQLRIGIHSGPIRAGVVGKKKFAYDIWGDTVNLASRMESTSEPGRINISESTYALVSDKFQFVSRGKIEAKNKGKIEMYFAEKSDQEILAGKK